MTTTLMGYDEAAALDLMDALIETPLDLNSICEQFEYTPSQARRLIRILRDDICPQFGVVIPHPLPSDGNRYHVTGEWVGDGGEGIKPAAEYALRHVLSRMVRLHSDVEVVLPNLEHGSIEWRQANFLHKHLAHIVGTLNEIGANHG